MSQLVIKSVESSEEELALRALATQAFNFPDDRWSSFVSMVGRENLRIAIASQDVVGGMSYYPIGQWFSGNRIPMAAIALVLMAPEHRGHGYAYRMLADVLRQLRADGYPIATLYASTQQFYRKLGFEQAGNSYDYALAIKDIETFKQVLPMRRVDPVESRDLLQSLATERAMREQGCLDRNNGMWERLFRDLGRKVYTYVVGEPGTESGYLIYEQSRGTGRSSPAEQSWPQRSIEIRDMVALDSEAMKTIWGFIAGNRPVTEMVKWHGPASDPRSLSTSEYEAKVIHPCRWMLRLLNVRKALLGRGYPRLDATISFDVTDDLIDENSGSFVLRVQNGTAEIDSGTTSTAIQIGARELAPLFSGLWTAEQLQRFGLLRCDDDQLVATATRVFASSEPWMPDSF